jgi:GT2 family glycosyltransferase
LIPAIIVPTLNRADLLAQMLQSIDVPVGKVVIIDNGQCVTEPWIHDTYDVVSLPHNIGVAASWNLGIKATPSARWWLIVNDDIIFAPGDLAEIEKVVSPFEPALWQAQWFSAFAITPAVLQVVGWFDENFVNGYCEDDDYARRCALAGVPIHVVPSGIVHLGSQSIRSDEWYWGQNAVSFPANVAYFEAKWGGSMKGGETFETPFNRGGRLDDVTLDIARVRKFTWQRKRK